MDKLSSNFSYSGEERIVKEILLTHVPNSQRVEVNSLLVAIESIVHYGCSSNHASTLGHHLKFMGNEVAKKADGIDGSNGLTIFSLSFQVMKQILQDYGTYETVLSIFDLLRNHEWGSKVVLGFAAFAKSYGEYLLIAHLYGNNPHETSIALFKQVPRNIKDEKTLEPCIKALKSLLKTIVNVIEDIIVLDDLPDRHARQEVDEMTATRILIHTSAYWVIRSCVACFSVYLDLTARNHDKLVGSGITWELWSLVYKLNGMHKLLREQRDLWNQYIEIHVGNQLDHIFKKSHSNNQEVLDIFLSAKDSPSIRKSLSSPKKVSLQELENKVVLLLFTTLDISLRQLLLLMQQIYSPTQTDFGNNYDVIWIPLRNSCSWTPEEVEFFNELANRLPCYCTSQPWCLPQVVEKYIKESWNFDHDPLIVVLDHQGKVSCSNATDMIIIWGAKAYPFSASSEELLWKEDSWFVEFIMRGVEPLTPMWVEEGKTMCIYGSNNVEWSIQFATQIANLKKAGGLIELIYVGNSIVEQKVRKIIASISDQKLGFFLPEAKIYLFWSRLMSMRNSRTRLAIDGINDSILREVIPMLNWDASMSSWVLFADGSSHDTLKIKGDEAMKLLSLHNTWAHYTGKTSLLTALKLGFNPPIRSLNSCGYRSKVPLSEANKEQMFLCKNCSSPMEKYVLYQCNGS